MMEEIVKEYERVVEKFCKSKMDFVDYYEFLQDHEKYGKNLKPKMIDDIMKKFDKSLLF